MCCLGTEALTVRNSFAEGWQRFRAGIERLAGGSPLAKCRAQFRFGQLVGRGRADVAQLVEHSLGKGEVTSSILVIGSIGLWKGTTSVVPLRVAKRP
jgi:hypothetical protein